MHRAGEGYSRGLEGKTETRGESVSGNRTRDASGGEWGRGEIGWLRDARETRLEQIVVVAILSF